MKIKNIFYLALACSFLFASCAKEEATDSFENIKLDRTFITVDAKGTPVKLTVTATEDWNFIVTDKWPQVFSFKKDDEGKTIKPKYDFWGNLLNTADVDESKTKDSWVKADVLSGKAGETTVTFTAEAFEGGREITLAMHCGTHKQHFVIRQGSLDPVKATCKEIKESAIVGASYNVSGTVTKLGNYSKYGAFYVNDGTYADDVQVYGSTSESIKDFPDVEVGDYVEFSGTWSSYKNFENVTITKHEKSLAKILTEPKTVSKNGEDVAFEVAFKGNGVEPSVPADYQSWISILGVKIRAGEKTKLDPNPASIATITIRVAKNDLSERNGAVTIASSVAKSTSTVTYEFVQTGSAIVKYDFNNGLENFTIEDKIHPSGLAEGKMVWGTATYGGESYMKASGYINKAQVDSESWLVSPVVDLTKVKSAKLSFTHALSNLKEGKIGEHIFLKAKKESDADWKDLAIPAGPTGINYDKFDAAGIDLKDFLGGKMQFAFVYKSTTACAPTWQVYKAMIEE